MKTASRVTASVLGVYARLLGIEHGYFEILEHILFISMLSSELIILRKKE